MAVETDEDLEKLFDSLYVLPKLIVFDLDNTLWTPELYQIRQRQVPAVNKEIRLFDAAQKILQFFASKRMEDWNVRLGLASRTSKMDWAHQLLDEFTVYSSFRDEDVSIRSLFPHIEIQTGSKRKHFANIRQATGYAYSEMLFIDDDLRMNLNEISQMGILCCHTPRGLTMEHFCKSLEKYSELKSGHGASHGMGYILNNDNLKIKEERVPTGKVLQGRIKFYSPQKRFGFVLDVESNQEFFFHESKVPAGMTLQSGNMVTFESSMDGGGRPSAVILPVGDAAIITTPPEEGTTEMPCFSMSQPFAALLLNGVKTVESRNNPMFQALKPGTQVLLACGRRDWPDQESYRQILQRSGMEESSIPQNGRFPREFRKGQVVGIITIGKTHLTSAAERNDPQLQRQVLAYADGIGKYCTEIRDAKWLTKPFMAKGQPGIYTVQAPTDCLPQ